MSSPYRIPAPPRQSEPDLDISPAVVVLTVAAVVAIVLLSHDPRPSRSVDGGIGGRFGASHSASVSKHR